MKLISLNTWGGRVGRQKYLDFLKENKDTDFFCFQEFHHKTEKYAEKSASGASLENIMTNQLEDTVGTLSEHNVFFRPHLEECYGLSVFVKKDIEMLEEGDVFVYKHKGYMPDGDIGNHARNIQYVTFLKDNKKFNIINFHGLWNGKGKIDSDDRLMQSDKIISFIKKLEGEIILVGDFNLLPDTQSLKKFEEFNLRNLIKENNITSTRSSHYTKPDKFADYAFITDGVEVKEFRVLKDEVSDHLPLYLEF